jgi:hypothetical protein
VAQNEKVNLQWLFKIASCLHKRKGFQQQIYNRPGFDQRMERRKGLENALPTNNDFSTFKKIHEASGAICVVISKAEPLLRFMKFLYPQR